LSCLLVSDVHSAGGVRPAALSSGDRNRDSGPTAHREWRLTAAHEAAPWFE